MSDKSQQAQRQPTASPRRRSSNGDLNRAPPRYSSLEAAFVENFSTAQTEAVPPTDLAPPRYSSVFSLTRTHTRRTLAHPGSNCIASSSPVQTAPDSHVTPSPSGPQVHEYYIKSGGKVWATLKVISRTSVGSSSSASSSLSSTQRVPRFTGSDLVQGILELNLETPQNINSISLSLRGRVITSSYEGGSCTFLDHPITSWARTNGDPRSLSPTPDGSATSSSSDTKKFDGKLSGNYSWSFSLPFPKEIAMGIQGEQQMHPTPQTFLERDTRGNVQDELVLRLTHGILRADSKLHANIVYVPDITPAPFSLLRQVAYGQNKILPRPDVDPSGWHTLLPVVVKGQLLADPDVRLYCTLSLANPQSYTRGTVIPCHISIHSNVVQALDLLVNPQAIAVSLMRCVQHPEDAGQSMPSASQRGKQRSDSLNGPMAENRIEVERAVWWFNPEAEGETGRDVHVRCLEGEIHLEKELQPSCGFSLFKVSYTVDFLPFECPVFRPADSIVTLNKDNDVSQIPLVSLPVTIATLHGEGPVPVTFTKPTPHSLRKKAGAKTYDANTSMNMTSMGIELMNR